MFKAEWHRSRHRSTLLVVFLGVLGALLAVWLFGRGTYSLGLARVRVSVKPSPTGETVMALTPVGEVMARTHDTPVQLTLELSALNFPALRRMAGEMPDTRVVVSDLEDRATGAAGRFAARLLVLSFLGGLLCSAMVLRGPLHRHLLAGGTGVLVVSLLLAGTVATFNRKAFANPRFAGPLAEAPEAVQMARDGLSHLSELRGRMDTVSDSVGHFYSSLEGTRANLPTADDIRVLHVTDIHNNPLGMEFIARFAGNYRVDLLVNTGDLTDFGVSVEDAVLQPMAKLTIPQLYVAGNHDSRATVAALRRLPRVTVLDGQVVVAQGIRFMGWADPVSRRAGYGSVDPTSADRKELEQWIRREVAVQAIPPDVLLVHNHRIAERLHGVAPVILYGHNHKPEARRDGDTLLVNAGTTGAAGARYFQRREGVPFSAAVLHFSRRRPGKLLAVDQLEMRGAEGEFTLRRLTLNGQLKAQ